MFVPISLDTIKQIRNIIDAYNDDLQVLNTYGESTRYRHAALLDALESLNIDIHREIIRRGIPFNV